MSIKAKAIAIHILQTLPCGLLNRDFQGQEKRITLGGSVRSRVSSQCWKKDLRERFEQSLPYQKGIRTSHLPDYAAQELRAAGVQELALRKLLKEYFGDSLDVKAAKKQVAAKPSKSSAAPLEWFEDVDKKIPTIKNVEFYSRKEIDLVCSELVARATGQSSDKTGFSDLEKTVGKVNGGISIATFGRMFASKDGLTVEGASLHNHPFSVGGLSAVHDDFVATDDFGEDRGSAFMDSSKLVSATYYRYHCLDLRTLSKNICDNKGLPLYGHTEAEVAEFFVKAAFESWPTAKRNSTGGACPVSYMLVEIIEKGEALQYANAFLAPVQDTAAQETLESYVKRQAHKRGSTFVCKSMSMDDSDGSSNIDDILAWVKANA